MVDTSIRLGSVLKFDGYKEKDIISAIKELTAQHKLGSYIENMIRFIWDNPEKFKGTDIDLSKYGVTTSRSEFFGQVAKEVQECRNAINQLYNEMMLLSTAAKVGQTFGLVENTSDILMGIECVERYTEKIAKEIGMAGALYEHGKISKAEDIANQASDILIKIMLAKNIDLRINQGASNTQNNVKNDENIKSTNESINIGSKIDSSENKSEFKDDVKTETIEVNSKNTNKDISLPANNSENNSKNNDDNFDLMAAFCGIS